MVSSPALLLKAVGWASTAIDGYNITRDAVQLAPQLLGANLSAATGSAVAHAASASQAVTLLLAAPEFMRR